MARPAAPSLAVPDADFARALSKGAVISNRVELRDNLGRFEAAVDRASEDALKYVAAVLARGTNRAVEYGRRSGSANRRRGRPHLKGSYRAYRIDKRTWVVGSKARHAASQEFGARPHMITARNKPRLIFYWEKRRRVVKTISVHHPGNPPYKGRGIVRFAWEVAGGREWVRKTYAEAYQRAAAESRV